MCCVSAIVASYFLYKRHRDAKLAEELLLADTDNKNGNGNKSNDENTKHEDDVSYGEEMY